MPPKTTDGAVEARVRREKALMRAVSGNKRSADQMPVLFREAPVRNVDAAARTFDVTWTTGARVRRYDYWRERFYMEELSLAPGAVRMGRLQSGRAPVLDSHASWSLSNVLGVVTSASLGGQDGSASIRMSARDEVAPVLADMKDGIICNVSVGYAVYRIEMIAPTGEDELWIYRIVDWEPLELSLVPIGADDGAGSRSEEDERFSRCEFLNAATAAQPQPGANDMDIFIIGRALGVEIAEKAEAPAVRTLVTKRLGLDEKATDEQIVMAAVRKEPAAPAPAADPVAAARAKADTEAAARKRAADVVVFCRKHKAGDELEAKALAEGWTDERCAAEILNQRAERGDTTGPSTIPNTPATRAAGNWDSIVKRHGGK